MWQVCQLAALCFLYKVSSLLPASLYCFPAGDAQLAAAGQAV